MQKRILFITVMLLSLLLSCKEKEENLDVLGLSLKECTIDSNAQSIKITAESNQWDIYCFGMNDSIYYFSDPIVTLIGSSSFKTEWFLVSIDKGNKSFNITFEENKGAERNMMLAIRTLGYHDQLKIVQKGKR